MSDQAERERINHVYRQWHGGAGLIRYAWHRPEVQRQEAERMRALADLLPSTVGTDLSALRAIDEQRVDPSSKEGKRVMDVLRRVDTQIDATAATARAEQEQEAADELVHEVESALEAAAEAHTIGRPLVK